MLTITVDNMKDHDHRRKEITEHVRIMYFGVDDNRFESPNYVSHLNARDIVFVSSQSQQLCARYFS